MDKNNIMMIVIIALLVILLGTIGFMSVYLINFFGEDDQAIILDEETEEPILPQSQLVMISYVDAVRGTITDKEGTSSHAVTFKVAVTIDNSDKKKAKEVEELQVLLLEREPIVKSFISETIYNYTAEDYNNNNDIMKATLSRDIKERLRLEFGTNLIYDVHLSDYLYQ